MQWPPTSPGLNEIYALRDAKVAKDMAKAVDAILNEIRGVFGEIGDQRLTVMSAITVLDQLSETERKLKGLDAEVRSLRESRDALLERQGEVERRLAEKVVEAAARIEAAAEKMV